jgi:hypothetical protein
MAHELFVGPVRNKVGESAPSPGHRAGAGSIHEVKGGVCAPMGYWIQDPKLLAPLLGLTSSNVCFTFYR